MSIDAIKNIYTNSVLTKSNTCFTSNHEAKPEDNKNGKNLLIAGLVALGAVGIYLVTRGKKGGSEIASETQRPAEQIKDMAIDAFKKAGNKFEKGKAKLANGENYTGTLVQETRDAKKIILKYNNGILEKAEKFDLQTGEKLYTKKYIYPEFNTERLVRVNMDNNVILQRYGSGVRTSKGYCSWNHDKSILTVRSKNGAEKSYEYINGKRILRTECKADNPSTLIFYRDDGTKEFALRGCTTIAGSCNTSSRWDGMIEIYDNNGEFVNTLERLDNSSVYYEYKNRFIKWSKDMSL